MTDSLAKIIRRRRRRIDPAQPLEKMTFQLTKSVAEAIRKVVQSGQVPSGNAFVEDAVIARLRELRREHLAREYERAANDPEFMREMEEIDEQFDVTTGDGLEDE